MRRDQSVWYVLSQHKGQDEPTVELRRTDKRTAYDDASILRDIGRRRVWVEEEEKR